jgi:hypothetical protein
VRALTAREREVSESLAFALADVLWERMPCLFSEPPEVVIGFTLPLACSLVRAEAKATRNRKHAKKYRRLQREVRELLRTRPDAAVPAAILARAVGLDPACGRTALVPGAAAETLEVP